MVSKVSMVKQIIVPLLQNKGVQILKSSTPIPYHLWHGVPILKPLPRLRKKLVNKIEAIVMDLLLCWLWVPVMKNGVVLQVITDVLPKGVPQSSWICRHAVLDTGNTKLTHHPPNG